MPTIASRTVTRIVALLALCLAGASIHAQELGQWSFADGAKDWTAVNQATVSEISRRPGGKSLRIRQNSDAEANSAWLSPVLANPGKPVRVSLWSASNYDSQQDHSYAASFELVPCSKDGTLTTSGGDWVYMPWEDKRQIPQFRHTLTDAGLQWKHYAAVRQAGGDFFRVRFCWPKTLMRGECYMTDVQVSLADGLADGEKAVAAATTNRHTLEISCAASGNLFFSDDPLRFEFLLYSTDGKEVGALAKPELRYDITDYEHFRITAGTLDFAPAAPVTIPPSHGRAQNLRLSALLPDAAAKEVGREFFLHAQLVSGGKVVAEDTVTYVVVAPRQTDPKDLAKCRFIDFNGSPTFSNNASKHTEQSLTAKMGVSMTQTWDYSGWRDAQPVKGGPITIPRGPDFPKLVYCPNLEQIRGRLPDHPWGDMTKNAPDWALNDDAFHPGCKGFEIDGYVAYIVAYVRANRHRIVQVVPSGLERGIDARTLELHRKAYAAIKAEFPDLPVGMMTWGMPDSAAMIDLILKEKLYEVADFFNTHVYQSGVGWVESDRLERELKKLDITRRMISTEFANVGGTDQLEGSRSIIFSMLDAHAHGMDRITYFLMQCSGRNPVLRGEFSGDGFAWMQYVDRPRVADSITDGDWSGGMWGADRRGSSLMPLLKTTAYYNFVQAVECADFKLMFRPTPRSIAYVYARAGKTICYVFLREPNAPTTLALKGEVAYTMQDLYGRTDRITPSGTSLIVATEDPLALLFDGELPGLYDPATAAATLQAVDGGLSLPLIARGASGTAVLSLPPVFGGKKLRVTATVDGTWPKLEPRELAVTADKAARLELPIAIAANQTTGSCTFTTRLYDGERLVSVLKQPLVVGEVLKAQLAGVPTNPTQDPAIVVTITSLANEPRSGTVRIANRFFGAGFTPDRFELPYTVGPRATVEVRFPVPRAQANLAVSYEMRATISDSSGFTLTSEDEVSFQACVKTTTPITIDGDLADWKLAALTPIPYEKWFNGPRDPKEFSGRFYSRWDAERLYFAAEITDSVAVANGTDNPFWNDDNIMFCLYPWGWHVGEPLNAGYYREHLGPTQGGKAAIWRVGNTPSGPATAVGAQIAVKRTATGWIYEWAYPQAAVHPLALKSGGAFRLSMSVWDQFKKDKVGEADWGTYSWLTFSGFNSSVNAQPGLWRQFTMVE